MIDPERSNQYLNIMANERPDWVQGLINTLGFGAVALVTVLIGTSEHPGWLFVSTPILCFVFGYFAGNKSLKIGLAFGAIGLAAGAGFYITI